MKDLHKVNCKGRLKSERFWKEMLEMNYGDWDIINTKRIELYQYHFHLG